MENQTSNATPEQWALYLEITRPICPGLDWPAEIEPMTFRYVYLGYSEKRGQWKIGVTGNLKRRAGQLGIHIVHAIHLRSEIAGLVETLLHKHYSYMDNPAGHEWFSLSGDSLEEIKGINTEKNIRGFCWVCGWRHIPKIGWVAVESGTNYSRSALVETVQESRRRHREFIKQLGGQP